MSKQKLLSIAIPSYNSEAYMAHAIESLLPGGDEVEILIVNDGSKDRTAEIADSYQAKYPGICRAIHQENGGHGAAVMSGLQKALKNATKEGKPLDKALADLQKSLKKQFLKRQQNLRKKQFRKKLQKNL